MLSKKSPKNSSKNEINFTARSPISFTASCQLKELISSKVEPNNCLQDMLDNVHFDTKKAMELVEKGADSDTKNYDGFTLIHCLTYKGDMEAIKLLVNHFDAHIDTPDDTFKWTPLQMFIETTQNGIGFSFPELIESLPPQMNFNIQKAMEFIRLGANPNTVFSTYFKKNTLLHLLVARKATSTLIEELVARGANIHAKNENGETPLQYLLKGLYGGEFGYFNPDMILTLLRLGANINDQEMRLGNSILHVLLYIKRLDLFRMIVRDFHADIHMRDAGLNTTPLQYLMYDFYYHKRHGELKFRTKDAFLLIEEFGADPESKYDDKSLFDIFDACKDKKSMTRLRDIIEKKKKQLQLPIQTVSMSSIGKDTKQEKLLKLDAFIKENELICKSQISNVEANQRFIAATIMRDIIHDQKPADLLEGYKNVIGRSDFLCSIYQTFDLKNQSISNTTHSVSSQSIKVNQTVNVENVSVEHVSGVDHDMEPGRFYPKICINPRGEISFQPPINDFPLVDYVHDMVYVSSGFSKTCSLLNPTSAALVTTDTESVASASATASEVKSADESVPPASEVKSVAESAATTTTVSLSNSIHTTFGKQSTSVSGMQSNAEQNNIAENTTREKPRNKRIMLPAT